MKFALCILLLILALQYSANSAPQYNISRIVVDSEGTPRPCSLNNHGQVAGESYDIRNSFVWQDCQVTLIGERTTATKINNHAQVTGYWFDDTLQYCRAFVWQNGHLTILPGAGGLYALDRGYDINDAGVVVGESWEFLWPEGRHRMSPVLWQDGEAHHLGSLGGWDGVALSVNNHNEVVGWSADDTHLARAFHWKDGVMSPLPGLSDGWAEAHLINDNGIIVGRSSSGHNHQSAVMWKNGDIYDLGHLEGWAALTGINNRDEIVGYHSTSETTRGFIIAAGSRRYLDELIDPDIGWQLHGALDINEHGWILGVGLQDGELAYGLLTPVPEPGAFMTMGVGVFALVVGYRRRKTSSI